MATWTEVVSKSLRDCNVYEHLIKQMTKQVVRFIDEEGFTQYAIRRGLRFCGVVPDDAWWMAEKIYHTCLEEYRKGKLR